MDKNEIILADKQRLLQIYIVSPKKYLTEVSNGISCIKDVYKNGREPMTIGELNRVQSSTTHAYIITCIKSVMEWHKRIDDMSNEQVNTLVNVFLGKYYYWSLEELSLCLRRVIDSPKSYEKNYGNITPSLFMSWFQDFDNERDSVVQMIVNKPKVDISKDAVSKEDYEEQLLAMAAGGDEEANKLYAAMIKRNEFFSKINYQKYGYDRKHKYDKRQTTMEQNRRFQKRTY